MICDDRWREEAGELKTVVTVRRAHHGNLDALVGKSGDTSCPFSFDRGSSFELEAELSEKINRLSEVIDDDSYVIHPFERHASTLQDVWHKTTLVLDERDARLRHHDRRWNSI